MTTITRTTRYILIDHTRVYWPGCLPYRSTGSRGYATREEAAARATTVMRAYAAKHGLGGPDLRVREVQ